MNLRLVRYFLLPHPLKRDSTALYSDPILTDKIFSETWEFYKSPLSPLPRTFRTLILPQALNASSAGEEASLEEIVREQEDLMVRRFRTALNRSHISLLMILLKGLIIAYLLLIAPPIVWTPIENLFNNVAHGLSDYAKWWIILFFPVRAFLRIFGTGIVILLPQGLKNNPLYKRIPLLGRIKQIGVNGQWQNLRKASARFGLYRELGTDFRSQWQEETGDLLETLKNQVKNQMEKDLSAGERYFGQLGDHFDLLFSKEPPAASSWGEQTRNLLDLGRDQAILSWSAAARLEALAESLLFFKLNGNFHFAPLLLLPPSSVGAPLFSTPLVLEGEKINPQSAILSEGLAATALQIEDFFTRPDVLSRFEQIHSRWEELEHAQEREAILRHLEALTEGFRWLRDEVGRLHLGLNPHIPREKGKEIYDYFHSLFLVFGRGACALENGYCRRTWGLTSLKSGRAVKKHRCRIQDRAWLFVEKKHLHRREKRTEGVINFFGGSLPAGLLLVVLVLGLLGSFFGFYILSPDARGAEMRLQLGIKGKFIGRDLVYTNYGEGFDLPFTAGELHWHPPWPLAEAYPIDPAKREDVQLHIILGEHHPSGLWEKTVTLLGGPLGQRYDVLQINMRYSPLGGEAWGEYNYDGKGYRRLMRDAGEIAENWKTNLLSDFDEGMTAAITDEEQAEIYGPFFKKLAERGILEEYIRRTFSQTAMSTNLLYGAPMERIRPGFEVVLGEIQRREALSHADILLSEEEKTAVLAEMGSARALVEETYELVKTQAEREFGELRRYPRILNGYTRDPYNHIPDIQNFETVWANLRSYVLYLYNKEKMIKFLLEDRRNSKQFGRADENSAFIGGLAEKLSEDPFLRMLITVHTLEYDIENMSVSEINTLQEKWRDLL